MTANRKSKSEMVDVTSELASVEADPARVAAYIGDMTIGLRELADQSDLTFLAYLLDLVYEESTIITRSKAS
jgi:hypothetical protein